MARAVTKEKLPHSSNADCCALDNEVPTFMFRPISAPACELPSPPPADASFQSKDTDKIIHPDLKNDRSSLDDEVAFFMSPSDVPLPPRPPPIAELGLGRKRRYSSVFSVNDEEEHLKPKRMRLMSCDVPVSSSPPPADASFQSKDTDKIMHPDFKYDCSSLDDELAFFTCPLPPRPPPIAELGLGRKRRYSSVFSVQDEEEHLMPKRMRLMTWDVSKSPAAEKNVCFPCPEDKRSDLLPLSSLQGHPPSQVNNNDTDQCTILLPPEIPVPPSPAPVGDLETVDFPCLDN